MNDYLNPSETLLAFTLATALLAALPVLDYHSALALMLLLLLLGLPLLGRGYYQEVLAIGFVSGVIGDAFLQAMVSLREGDERSAGLRTYFGSVGSFDALLMGGALTAGMTLHTTSICLALGFQTTYAFLAVGVVIGALWGVVAEPSRAGEPMLPFYQGATTGYLENRVWDATTIPIVLLIYFAYRGKFVSPLYQN